MLKKKIVLMSSIKSQLLQIGETLRGYYRPAQYETIILPLVILRRLDASVADSKTAAKIPYQSNSGLSFTSLASKPDEIAPNFMRYLNGFPQNVQALMTDLEFLPEIPYLIETGLLAHLICQFSQINLAPSVIDTVQMGEVFELLITQFNQSSNEQTGDYFTPREIVHLMVKLLFATATPSDSRSVKCLFDPTCGTGGMLSSAKQYVKQHYPEIELKTFGQDFNRRAYAIAYADALLQGEETQIKFGDSLINDQFPQASFDYFLANPPFGVNWRSQQAKIVQEYQTLGKSGRFGAGIPRVSDGSLLFLQHLIHKFKKTESRCAIVFSGSPLFTGQAGSGESEIRRWIIENDWLEAIVALPEQTFQNTEIGTYIWIISNHKTDQRQGKIQLIDAKERWHSLRRSVGKKRRYLDTEDIQATIDDYSQFKESDTSKIFSNADFGYFNVTVERPLRLAFKITTERKVNFLQQFPHRKADIEVIEAALGNEEHLNWNQVMRQIAPFISHQAKWKKLELKQFRDSFTERNPDAEAILLEPLVPILESGRQLSFLEAETPFNENKATQWEPDNELRDTESIPLKDSIKDFFAKEILPYVPDAWINESKTCIGYEINFQRHFYKYIPPRPLEEITAEILELEKEISKLLQDIC